MPGTGLGFGLGIAKHGGFSPEYDAVYNALTTKPSDAIAAEQDKLVKALIGAGVWAKSDAFYLLAQTTNGDGEALLNWISPGTYNATILGSPTFTALEGFTGNSIDASINTNLPLGMTGLKYTLNDASWSFYNRVADVTDYMFAGPYMSCQGISLARMRLRINDATNDLITNGDNRGTITGSRTAANVKKGYQNKVEEFSVATPSVALPATGVYILSQNAAGWSDAQISMWMCGSGITKAQHDAVHDAIEAYMDSNGKGVVT